MSETGLAFLLFYVTGLSLALFVRPIYGLYTYIGVFYLHPPSRWWGAMLPDLRWSLLASLVTLVSLAIHANKRKSPLQWYHSRIILIFSSYAAWMWIQLIWAPSTSHLTGTVLFTKYILLLAVIYSILDNESDLRGFCRANVLGCAYLGLLVFMASDDAGRLEGVGGPGIDDANTLGMHLSAGLFFAAFLLLLESGWRRWAIVALIPFILNGVIQTESRGALLGLLCGGLATVYLKPKRYRKIYYGLAVVAAVGFISLANEAFIERMESMTAAVNEEKEWDRSAESRLFIIKDQFEIFKDYPLGVGHEGTAFLSRAYISDEWLAETGTRASHNTVMSVLVDQGAPGIIIYFILGLAICRRIIKLKRMEKKGLPNAFGLYRAMLGGALVTIFTAGMFAQYLKAEIQIWCIGLVAVLWDLARMDRAEAAGKHQVGKSPPAVKPAAGFGRGRAALRADRSLGSAPRPARPTM